MNESLEPEHVIAFRGHDGGLISLYPDVSAPHSVIDGGLYFYVRLEHETNNRRIEATTGFWDYLGIADYPQQLRQLRDGGADHFTFGNSQFRMEIQRQSDRARPHFMVQGKVSAEHSLEHEALWNVAFRFPWTFADDAHTLNAVIQQWDALVLTVQGWGFPF